MLGKSPERTHWCEFRGWPIASFPAPCSSFPSLLTDRERKLSSHTFSSLLWNTLKTNRKAHPFLLPGIEIASMIHKGGRGEQFSSLPFGMLLEYAGVSLILCQRWGEIRTLAFGCPGSITRYRSISPKGDQKLMSSFVHAELLCKFRWERISRKYVPTQRQQSNRAGERLKLKVTTMLSPEKLTVHPKQE